MRLHIVQVAALLLGATLARATPNAPPDTAVAASAGNDAARNELVASHRRDPSPIGPDRASARQQLLAAIPRSERIIMSAWRPQKYRVTVFTDTDCPYCRKLHQQVEDYLRAGIEVQYIFYPRAGLDSPSYAKAVAVWCSDDRRASLAAALDGADLPLSNCANPVAEHYELAVRMGLLGTPALVTEDGVVMYGAAPVSALLDRLNSLNDARGKAPR